jgi:hypothetical protein
MAGLVARLGGVRHRPPLASRPSNDAAGNVQADDPPWNRLGFGNTVIEVSYVDVR